ncbi:MAG TPA: dephospho-CoA kinase [Desulfuromonadales bacterium]|nr:dephospho-CoA kinase [Desulfuromonadales bacterium]
MPPHIRIIGLTGGIATGKSSVARFFAEKGVPVIDADQLARDVVVPASPALDRIVAGFGPVVLTQEGALDRKLLGSMVFSNPEKRRLLENILHPEIRKLSEIRISAAAAAGHDRLIYMAPILIEAGAESRVDTIWVVTLRPEIQLERLMRRDSITRDQALKIIASQMPLAEKERYGNVIIDNSGTESETWKILESVWSQETGGSDG